MNISCFVVILLCHIFSSTEKTNNRMFVVLLLSSIDEADDFLLSLQRSFCHICRWPCLHSDGDEVITGGVEGLVCYRPIKVKRHPIILLALPWPSGIDQYKRYPDTSRRHRSGAQWRNNTHWPQKSITNPFICRAPFIYLQLCGKTPAMVRNTLCYSA